MTGRAAGQVAASAVAAWVTRVAERPRTAIAGLAVIVLLALLALTRLGIDTDSRKMLAPDLPFQLRGQAVNAAFPGLKNQVLVAVRGERADPVDAVVATLTDALEDAPGVAAVFAPSADAVLVRSGMLYLDQDVLEAQLTRLAKSANLLAALRGDQTLEGFIAALGEAARLAERADIPRGALDALHAEAAAVVEGVLAGTPRSFAWSDALAGTGPVLRVITVSPSLDFARVNPAKTAMQSVEAAVAALDPALAAEVEIGLTGDPVLRAEELRSVAGGMPLSLGLSLLLVAAVLWVSLGSAARAGLAFGSLVLTLMLTTGFAALAVGELNLVAIAFIVLMVGLGIDFAIHLMLHLEEDAAYLPVEEALAASARGLGPALVLTAVSTSAAFLAFAVTDFVGMAQLGLIGGAGVLIAFAVSLTLIPAAVRLSPGLIRRQRRETAVKPGTRPRPPSRLAAWLALATGLGALVLATEARFDADPMGLRDPDARSVAVYGWLQEDPALAPLRLSLLVPDADTARAEADRLAALPEVRSARWLGSLVPQDQEAKLALIDLVWPSLDYAVSGTAVSLAEDLPRTPEALADALGEGGAAGRLADALRTWARSGASDDALTARLFAHFPALIERLASQLDVAEITASDLPDPLRARYVTTADGALLYRVEIVPEADVSDPEARAAFVRAVRQVAPGAGGPPDQIEGAANTVATAMLRASLLALAFTALLAFAAVRSLAMVAAILVPVGLAGAVTLAAGVLLGMPLNNANIIVLPLLIGIGVDTGIHLALRAERSGAVFATATPRAVVASALTTIGAFATLALSDHRGTASMGTLLAIALVAAVAMAFALTPWLVRLARPTEPTDIPR
ncbi:MAG: MMPL family transporter [Pseudomonadota bacterium]